MISFRCSTCRARIKAPWQLVGKTRTCPNCGNQFVVRPTVPDDVGPMLLIEDRKGGARPSPGLAAVTVRSRSM